MCNVGVHLCVEDIGDAPYVFFKLLMEMSHQGISVLEIKNLRARIYQIKMVVQALNHLAEFYDGAAVLNYKSIVISM